MIEQRVAAVTEPEITRRAMITAMGVPAAVWVLALAHGLVDCHATFVQPLWPTLVQQAHTNEGRMQWTFMAWSLAGSITQFGFARLADNGRGRMLLWLGPLAGIVLIGILGRTHGLASMTAALVVANLGFAAFHPEAATLAGAAGAMDRARAMSIFAVGGYLGQALGPSLSGLLVSQNGLSGLIWTIAPGLSVCCMLILGLKVSSRELGMPSHEATQPAHGKFQKSGHKPLPLKEIFRGRGARVAHLVVLSILRVAAAMGVPLTLVYGLSDLGVKPDLIGEIQSVFLIGMGAGTLACALLVNPRNENAVIRLAPSCVAFLLPLAAMVPIERLWIVMAMCGPLLGLSLPILTSRGQELLPDAPRVGSSLTMGVTWGVGGILVACLMAVVNYLDNHFLGFYVLGIWALMSAAMSWPGWATRIGKTRE